MTDSDQSKEEVSHDISGVEETAEKGAERNDGKDNIEKECGEEKCDKEDPSVEKDSMAKLAISEAQDFTRDPVMMEISMRLECCSCANIIPPPIQQCNSGHTLCKACVAEALRSSKNSACPSCLVPIVNPATNVALARIAEPCVVKCGYPNCSGKYKHGELALHMQHCRLSRRGLVMPKFTKVQEAKEEDEPKASELLQVVSNNLQCNFCAEICPRPIRQCENGHVACTFCLDRLKQTENPSCPFCTVSMVSTARNLHLEELAAPCIVACRYDGCDLQVKHSKLTEHLAICDHQPIKCGYCKSDSILANWDAMWIHYKERHMEHATKTPLSNMALSNTYIKKMLEGNLEFITWGHSVDANDNPVRLFPGMYYSAERKTFYFTIRKMGPLTGECFSLSVSSETSSIRMKGWFPCISYRIPHEYTTDMPCLAIAASTMKLMIDGSEGILFQITPPEECANLN